MISAKTDWRLLGAILLMLVFGLTMVYSASSVPLDTPHSPRRAETWDIIVRQSIFAIIGLALMLLVKSLDYRWLRHPFFAFVPLGIVVILMIGVIFADPKAHRWYRFAGMQFQPSELAKPALVVFLAYFLTRRSDQINNARHTLLPAAIVFAGLAAAVVAGDLGTAVILAVPAIALFFVAGLSRRNLSWALAGGVALAGIAIISKPYRIIRLAVFVLSLFNVQIKEADLARFPLLKYVQDATNASNSSRDNWQLEQSKTAIGLGGVLGVGVGNSNQKLGFLPEQHTDFIFAILAEETGLIISLILLSGYLYVFWRGLRLYWTAPDPFGRYLALGAVTMLTAQALFNMSVALGIAPTKGIPLPLISYGGSALICTLITLGLLLSVSERAES